MNTPFRAFILVLLFPPTASKGLQSMADKPGELVEVSGRLTNTWGHTLGGVTVSVIPLDSAGPARRVSLTSQYDGRFSFSGKPLQKYKLSTDEFKVIPAAIETGVGPHIDIGDVIVQPVMSAGLTLDQITIDPIAPRYPLTGFESLTLENPPGATSRPQDPCFLDMGQYTTIERFLGGQAKFIRVVAGLSTSQPAEIRARVLESWSGVFRYAACQPMWSEGANFSIKAYVEYEDGKHSTLLMGDGIHVQLRDREGKDWSLRLWPSM